MVSGDGDCSRGWDVMAVMVVVSSRKASTMVSRSGGGEKARKASCIT